MTGVIVGENASHPRTGVIVQARTNPIKILDCVDAHEPANFKLSVRTWKSLVTRYNTIDEQLLT